MKGFVLPFFPVNYFILLIVSEYIMKVDFLNKNRNTFVSFWTSFGSQVHC